MLTNEKVNDSKSTRFATRLRAANPHESRTFWHPGFLNLWRMLTVFKNGVSPLMRLNKYGGLSKWYNGADSKSVCGNVTWVRIPHPPPQKSMCQSES